MEVLSGVKTEVLSVNGCGVKMIKRTYVSESVVSIVDSKHSSELPPYIFNNVNLDYDDKYMNWANLNTCGGWEHKEEDHMDQMESGRKLFAQIIIDRSDEKHLELDYRILQYLRANKDDVSVFEFRHFYPSMKEVIVVKKGCLKDYIDVENILENYYKLGMEKLTAGELELLNRMSSIPMFKYMKPEENFFNYDFRHIKDKVELIFTGMLLGYPIESTMDRMKVFI